MDSQHKKSSSGGGARNLLHRYRSQRNAEDHPLSSKLSSMKAKGFRQNSNNTTRRRSSMNFANRLISGANCQAICGRSHQKRPVSLSTGDITRSAVSDRSSARLKQSKPRYG